MMRLLGQSAQKNPAQWQHLWVCDHGRCQGPYCRDKPAWSLALEACYVARLKSAPLNRETEATWHILCRRCYVLRADSLRVGLIASALGDDMLGPEWRALVWQG